jgi:hypothetical protein
MSIPLNHDPVSAYHGDTTEILAGVSVAISDDAGAAVTTARLQLRAQDGGKLYVEIVPTVTASTLGGFTVAPVTVTPTHWASIRRDVGTLDFDLETTHPVIGTRTLVRGTVAVRPDITFTP